MNTVLLDRINAFSFDEAGVEYSYTARLAAENDWPSVYTDRVVQEYRRFLYMSVVAEHMVSPSDAVDQAWHLHLCYTRSYWIRMCREVLDEPLHHMPSNGGEGEKQKYEALYVQTLESYEQLFGEKPPADIWPSIEQKARIGQFKRVNCTRNFVLNKRSLFAAALLLFGGLSLAGCANALGMTSEIPLPVIFFAVFFLIALVLVIKNSGKGGGGCSGGCGGGCGGCGGD